MCESFSMPISYDIMALTELAEKCILYWKNRTVFTKLFVCPTVRAVEKYGKHHSTFPSYYSCSYTAHVHSRVYLFILL